MTQPHLLAIDAGTTSTRALIFTAELALRAMAQDEIEQFYPAPGLVEHDGEEILEKTVAVARAALAKAGLAAGDIAAIGITNQRETTLIWDRKTGKPLHRAIVWQDRRTEPMCEALREAGLEGDVARRTGLRLDPYFSATKIAWVLDAVPGARARAEAGELAFGTVESWLVYRLTGGAVHASDATNAARTALFDIHKNAWSASLCKLFDVPMALLPQVKDCVADFGQTTPDVLGSPVAITGMAGDQQAALIGQACFEPGMMKATYGTGCFAVINTGERPVTSRHGLLTTIGYRLAGKTTYALEGSIFIAGAAVQWLRDGLGIIADGEEATRLAEQADPADETVLVPAFVGLGAPHWDSKARASLHAMTRATGKAELCRAALDASAFQTHDLINAMQADDALQGRLVLRVDGGMARSDFAMQRLADLLDAPVDRPQVTETTALGAALLAGLGCGLVASLEGFARRWQVERRFEPAMAEGERRHKLANWQRAIERTLT